MPSPRRNYLNSRINAYRQSAGARIASGSAERFGNWFVYAAAAGSALALSSNASASIVYGTVNETASIAPLNGAPGTHFANASFNVDGALFQIRVVSGNFGGSHTNFALLAQGANLASNAGIELNNSHQLKRLASGNQVSAGNIAFPKAHEYDRILFGTCHSYSCNHITYGTWPKSQKGFAGIGIKKNGNTYLGWLRLEYFESSRGVVDKIEAFDYAYNTVAGVPIAAGDVGVPEPSTAALTLLAAGAAGVAALRRRRAAKA